MGCAQRERARPATTATVPSWHSGQPDRVVAGGALGELDDVEREDDAAADTSRSPRLKCSPARGNVSRKKPAEASVDARRRSRREGSCRVRRYAANGVSTTDSPVRNAAFDAVVSGLAENLERHAAREQRADDEAVAARGPASRGRSRTSSPTSADASRNRQKRNCSGGTPSSAFFTTTNDEPQTSVTPTRTASARGTAHELGPRSRRVG